ncbi:hypothetical protein HN954_00240 [bacterium]|jgi:hypothetical protein|nr:hypothetical protein [bacterium]MBT6832064.1 hypothetical protein [bacterium]MBT6995845.1 hypothetical protein [bacterium]MBT7772344.1 hypothetical protein [bacterium]
MAEAKKQLVSPESTLSFPEITPDEAAPVYATAEEVTVFVESVTAAHPELGEIASCLSVPNRLQKPSALEFEIGGKTLFLQKRNSSETWSCMWNGILYFSDTPVDRFFVEDGEPCVERNGETCKISEMSLDPEVVTVIEEPFVSVFPDQFILEKMFGPGEANRDTNHKRTTTELRPIPELYAVIPAESTMWEFYHSYADQNDGTVLVSFKLPEEYDKKYRGQLLYVGVDKKDQSKARVFFMGKTGDCYGKEAGGKVELEKDSAPVTVDMDSQHLMDIFDHKKLFEDQMKQSSHRVFGIDRSLGMSITADQLDSLILQIETEFPQLVELTKHLLTDSNEKTFKFWIPGSKKPFVLQKYKTKKDDGNGEVIKDEVLAVWDNVPRDIDF